MSFWPCCCFHSSGGFGWYVLWVVLLSLGRRGNVWFSGPGSMVAAQQMQWYGTYTSTHDVEPQLNVVPRIFELHWKIERSRRRHNTMADSRWLRRNGRGSSETESLTAGHQSRCHAENVQRPAFPFPASRHRQDHHSCRSRGQHCIRWPTMAVGCTHTPSPCIITHGQPM